MFPVINHIDDVLPHIKEFSEFYVAERDGYRVINYMVNTPQSFGLTADDHGDAIRRECRGIMFGPDGKIIRRPLHKFFNYGEKPIEDASLDFTNAEIYEKLDGSMIAPFYVNGVIRLGSKMGLTDVSLQAETFIQNKSNYIEFIQECLDNEFTPIFEWTSRKQRIVIDYPEDNLVLLAIRNMITGEYHSYVSMLLEAGVDYDIPVVKKYDLNLENMNMLQEHTKGLKNQEGFVVVFSNNHRVKLKADEYLRIHKAKDQITSEKNVLNLIFNENIDDIIPHLLKEDQEKILKFEEEILKSVENSAIILNDTIKMFKKMYPTRKEYGLNVSNNQQYNLSVFSSVRNTIAFKLFEKDFNVHEVRKELIEYIKKNINTSTKIESIRHIFRYNKWNYNEGIE